MILDRELQYKLLNQLADIYPSYIDFGDEYKKNEPNYKSIIANVYYLQSHGLLSEGSILISKTIGENSPHILNRSQITHKGMDFLADDGGLSAILGVVTVKFEAETLKAILINKVNQSALTPADKKGLIDGLRELPAESIKHLTTKILDSGYDNLDSLMTLIQSNLGSLF